MSEPPREGQLIAYIADGDPHNYLFHGQPGVVLDVGPTPDHATVSLASGPSLGIPATDLAAIDIDEYRHRAARMRDGLHPTRDEPIIPLEVGDPIDGPANMPPGSTR